MLKWIVAGLAAALVTLAAPAASAHPVKTGVHFSEQVATDLSAARRHKKRKVRRVAVLPRVVPLPRPRILACLDKPPTDFSAARMMARVDPQPNEAEPVLPFSIDGVYALAQATDYLIETALQGDTMRRQGADVAIGRLHPVFRLRLAQAIREARAEGIKVGIYSAYRPPAFGVGGFRDKGASYHAYGLAVDVYGIGRPGSPTSRRWYLIAGRNKIYNPYGPWHRAEWNHFQPTFSRAVARRMELRTTITAKAPKDLLVMWTAGLKLISDRIVLAEPPRQRVKKRRHYGSRYARRSPIPKPVVATYANANPGS